MAHLLTQTRFRSAYNKIAVQGCIPDKNWKFCQFPNHMKSNVKGMFTGFVREPALPFQDILVII